MGEDDEPPYEGEQKPGEDEGEGEHEQRPAPLGVHEGGEDVLQVSAPALGHVPLDNVAVSVFEDDALFHASGSVAGLTVSGTDTFHVKIYLYSVLCKNLRTNGFKHFSKICILEINQVLNKYLSIDCLYYFTPDSVHRQVMFKWVRKNT